MTIPSFDHRAILVGRMWLLLLFDACERAGVAPLSVERLHRLVYLANALAPVYDLPVPDGYILKYRRGPFFPMIHWDTGRLVAQGLINVTNARPIKDALGYWIAADYGLSQKGMQTVDDALTIETVPHKATYLREVALAFAGIEARERDSAALVDVNYEPAGDETPVDFGDSGDNLSPTAAESLVALGAPPVRRLRLHRYFHYLERAWHERQRRTHVG